MIRAGLTSIGLLNAQGNLFILGALSENIICDDPYNVTISCIVDFSFSGNGCLYTVTSTGEAYVVNGAKKGIKIYKLDSMKDIK